MSDVRTQIRNIIWNVYAAGYRDGRNGDSEDVAGLTRGRADRIIALVREALLSDNVVAEASVQIDDSWDVPEHALMETARLTIETALDIAGIIAALDTAFVPASDQHGTAMKESERR